MLKSPRVRPLTFPDCDGRTGGWIPHHLSSTFLSSYVSVSRWWVPSSGYVDWPYLTVTLSYGTAALADSPTGNCRWFCGVVFSGSDGIFSEFSWNRCSARCRQSEINAKTFISDIPELPNPDAYACQPFWKRRRQLRKAINDFLDSITHTKWLTLNLPVPLHTLNDCPPTSQYHYTH